MLRFHVPIEIVCGAESFSPRASHDVAPEWFSVSQVMLLKF
jgi:hypothetical protein